MTTSDYKNPFGEIRPDEFFETPNLSDVAFGAEPPPEPLFSALDVVKGNTATIPSMSDFTAGAVSGAILTNQPKLQELDKQQLQDIAAQTKARFLHLNGEVYDTQTDTFSEFTPQQFDDANKIVEKEKTDSLIKELKQAKESQEKGLYQKDKSVDITLEKRKQWLQNAPKLELGGLTTDFINAASNSPEFGAIWNSNKPLYQKQIETKMLADENPGVYLFSQSIYPDKQPFLYDTTQGFPVEIPLGDTDAELLTNITKYISNAPISIGGFKTPPLIRFDNMKQVPIFNNPEVDFGVIPLKTEGVIEQFIKADTLKEQALKAKEQGNEAAYQALMNASQENEEIADIKAGFVKAVEEMWDTGAGKALFFTAQNAAKFGWKMPLFMAGTAVSGSLLKRAKTVEELTPEERAENMFLYGKEAPTPFEQFQKGMFEYFIGNSLDLLKGKKSATVMGEGMEKAQKFTDNPLLQLPVDLLAGLGAIKLGEYAMTKGGSAFKSLKPLTGGQSAMASKFKENPLVVGKLYGDKAGLADVIDDYKQMLAELGGGAADEGLNKLAENMKNPKFQKAVFGETMTPELQAKWLERQKLFVKGDKLPQLFDELNATPTPLSEAPLIAEDSTITKTYENWLPNSKPEIKNFTDAAKSFGIDEVSPDLLAVSNNLKPAQVDGFFKRVNDWVRGGRKPVEFQGVKSGGWLSSKEGIAQFDETAATQALKDRENIFGRMQQAAMSLGVSDAEMQTYGTVHYLGESQFSIPNILGNRARAAKLYMPRNELIAKIKSEIPELAPLFEPVSLGGKSEADILYDIAAKGAAKDANFSTMDALGQLSVTNNQFMNGLADLIEMRFNPYKTPDDLRSLYKTFDSLKMILGEKSSLLRRNIFSKLHSIVQESHDLAVLQDLSKVTSPEILKDYPELARVFENVNNLFRTSTGVGKQGLSDLYKEAVKLFDATHINTAEAAAKLYQDAGKDEAAWSMIFLKNALNKIKVGWGNGSGIMSNEIDGLSIDLLDRARLEALTKFDGVYMAKGSKFRALSDFIQNSQLDVLDAIEKAGLSLENPIPWHFRHEGIEDVISGLNNAKTIGSDPFKIGGSSALKRRTGAVQGGLEYDPFMQLPKELISMETLAKNNGHRTILGTHTLSAKLSPIAEKFGEGKGVHFDEFISSIVDLVKGERKVWNASAEEVAAAIGKPQKFENLETLKLSMIDRGRFEKLSNEYINRLVKNGTFTNAEGDILKTRLKHDFLQSANKVGVIHNPVIKNELMLAQSTAKNVVWDALKDAYPKIIKEFGKTKPLDIAEGDLKGLTDEVMSFGQTIKKKVDTLFPDKSPELRAVLTDSLTNEATKSRLFYRFIEDKGLSFDLEQFLKTVEEEGEKLFIGLKKPKLSFLSNDATEVGKSLKALSFDMPKIASESFANHARFVKHVVDKEYMVLPDFAIDSLKRAHAIYDPNWFQRFFFNANRMYKNLLFTINWPFRLGNTLGDMLLYAVNNPPKFGEFKDAWTTKNLTLGDRLMLTPFVGGGIGMWETLKPAMLDMLDNFTAGVAHKQFNLLDKATSFKVTQNQKYFLNKLVKEHDLLGKELDRWVESQGGWSKVNLTWGEALRKLGVISKELSTEWGIGQGVKESITNVPGEYASIVKGATGQTGAATKGLNYALKLKQSAQSSFAAFEAGPKSLTFLNQTAQQTALLKKVENVISKGLPLTSLTSNELQQVKSLGFALERYSDMSRNAMSHGLWSNSWLTRPLTPVYQGSRFIRSKGLKLGDYEGGTAKGVAKILDGDFGLGLSDIKFNKLKLGAGKGSELGQVELYDGDKLVASVTDYGDYKIVEANKGSVLAKDGWNGVHQRGQKGFFQTTGGGDAGDTLTRAVMSPQLSNATASLNQSPVLEGMYWLSNNANLNYMAVTAKEKYTAGLLMPFWGFISKFSEQFLRATLGNAMTGSVDNLAQIGATIGAMGLGMEAWNEATMNEDAKAKLKLAIANKPFYFDNKVPVFVGYDGERNPLILMLDRPDRSMLNYIGFGYKTYRDTGDTPYDWNGINAVQGLFGGVLSNLIMRMVDRIKHREEQGDYDWSRLTSDFGLNRLTNFAGDVLQLANTKNKDSAMPISKSITDLLPFNPMNKANLLYLYSPTFFGDFPRVIYDAGGQTFIRATGNERKGYIEQGKEMLLNPFRKKEEQAPPSDYKSIFKEEQAPPSDYKSIFKDM